MLSHFSYVQLFTPLWTVAHQAPLSIGFSRQKLLEWVAMLSSRGSSGSRDQPAPLMSPALAGGFFTTSATWGSLLSILYEASFIYSFINLFFGSSGSLLLHMGFSCSERGLFFMVVSGLLIEMASLIVELRL